MQQAPDRHQYCLQQEWAGHLYKWGNKHKNSTQQRASGFWCTKDLKVKHRWRGSSWMGNAGYLTGTCMDYRSCIHYSVAWRALNMSNEPIEKSRPICEAATWSDKQSGSKDGRPHSARCWYMSRWKGVASVWDTECTLEVGGTGETAGWVAMATQALWLVHYQLLPVSTMTCRDETSRP